MLLRRSRRALEATGEQTWLLLENSAGAGGTIGRSIDELVAIVERSGTLRASESVSTAAICGYRGSTSATPRPSSSLLDELDDGIGLERLRALHVNDAAAPLGSNRDRHANLGEGLIGDGLAVFVGNPRLQDLPAVLETPGSTGHGPDETSCGSSESFTRPLSVPRRAVATRWPITLLL